MDDTFIDYYTVLGVDTHASTDAIKAAFKKLALQYHPDIYKGEDAEERMRLLLLAYQTLSDPDARKTYDAHHSGHLLDPSGRMHSAGSQYAYRAGQASSRPVQTSARTSSSKAGQRHFAFPDLSEPLPSTIFIDLGDVSYNLSPPEASTLRQEGILRGDEREKANRATNYCHRCHHRWMTNSVANRSSNVRTICPSCKASDWSEYLLLRCSHCHAVFESEEIRDKIIGQGRPLPVFQPYELFPLCPNCRRSQWCPAENARVQTLRAAVARRTAILWLSVLVVVILILGVVVLTLR